MASMHSPKPDARILNVPVAPAKPPAPDQSGQDTPPKSASNSIKSCQNPPNPANTGMNADAAPAQEAQKVLKSTQIVSRDPVPSAGGQADDREVAQKVLKSTQIVSRDPVPSAGGQADDREVAQKVLKSTQIVSRDSVPSAGGQADDREVAQKVLKSTQIVSRPPENPKSASHALEIHTPQPVLSPHSMAQTAALVERPDLGQRRSSMLQRMDESQYFSGEQLFVYCLATGVHVIEAARVSGLSRATAYRRCHDKKLRKHVKQLRSQIESRKVGMLMDSTVDAIRTLRELLEDDSPKVRLAAANCLLRHATASALENSDPVFSDRGINMMQIDPISEDEIKFMGEDSK